MTIDRQSLKLCPSQNRRAWRNWQTRNVEVVVGVTPWRFKSSRPHSVFLEGRSFWAHLSLNREVCVEATLTFPSNETRDAAMKRETQQVQTVLPCVGL